MSKRKEKRQQRKAERKAKMSEMVSKVEAVAVLPDESTVDDYVAKFNDYWPAMRATLDYLAFIKLTGKRLDAKINAVIAEGDKLHNNADLASEISGFINKIKAIWKRVRKYLSILMSLNLTGDKFDAVLEKIIDIGDKITGLDTDDDDEADDDDDD